MDKQKANIGLLPQFSFDQRSHPLDVDKRQYMRQSCRF